MALALYMDHHVARAITNGLRQRGIDVLTAEQDGAKEFDDSRLLDRASSLSRVLFTRDDDLLREAANRQRKGIEFFGIVYAHQLQVSIGTCITDLELFCTLGTPREVMNDIFFLPL